MPTLLIKPASIHLVNGSVNEPERFLSITSQKRIKSETTTEPIDDRISESSIDQGRDNTHILPS